MTAKPVKKPRLREAQVRFLKNLWEGNILHGHCKTSSDYGGLHGTTMWSRRRGYTMRKPDGTLTLTLAGRDLVRLILDLPPDAKGK